MANAKMAELYAKMQEYVKMEDELPFSDFSNYYQDLMACLQADYQDLATEELVQAQGICGIVSGNAKMRSLQKDEHRKKFLKINEKAEFWKEAIRKRLVKEGLTEAEIDEKTEGLWPA